MIGRPPKPEKENRTKRIMVYLTPSEYEFISNRAESLKLARTVYMRNCALNRELPPPEQDDESR